MYGGRAKCVENFGSNLKEIAYWEDRGTNGRTLLHVHQLLGNGLVNKFPRRQILGKQFVARLRNNPDSRRSVFNVVRAMPSARQQNCEHVYNNRRYFLCMVRAESL
jgi:hypothetical protein